VCCPIFSLFTLGSIEPDGDARALALNGTGREVTAIAV